MLKSVALSKQEAEELKIEKGKKLNAQSGKWGIQGDQQAKVQEVSEFKLGDGPKVVVELGCYHTCDEFVSKAKMLRHPFDGHESVRLVP